MLAGDCAEYQPILVLLITGSIRECRLLWDWIVSSLPLPKGIQNDFFQGQLERCYLTVVPYRYARPTSMGEQTFASAAN
jgi:hypothetical protein